MGISHGEGDVALIGLGHFNTRFNGFAFVLQVLKLQKAKEKATK